MFEKFGELYETQESTDGTSRTLRSFPENSVVVGGTLTVDRGIVLVAGPDRSNGPAYFCRYKVMEGS